METGSIDGGRRNEVRIGMGPLVDPPSGDRTIGGLLRYAASRFGDRPFVCYGGRTVTYEQANRRANRVANALQEIGVAKGARVAIFCSNRPEYLDLWFGLAKLGAIELPINTAYKASQILHTLIRSSAQVAVVEVGLLPEFMVAARQIPDCRILVLDSDGEHVGESYQALIAAAPEGEPDAAPVLDTDPVAIMSTSGTTGLSKGVLLPHFQQYSLGQNMCEALQVTETDVFYNNFPLYHNTAQAMITLPVLLSGASMSLVDKFSLSRFFPDVVDHGATLFYFIGEMLHLLVRNDTNDAQSHGCRLRAGWGIGAPAADMRMFEQRYGVRLGTCYGSTEGNVPVFRPLDSKSPDDSVGRVIHGFGLRIVDETEQPVAPGVVGEIVQCADVSGMMMIGYDGDPEATASALRDGWFFSGDAGSLDADGNLYFAGRIKDVIRVGGENVSGFEIEQALIALDGVAEVAAIAVERDIGGDDIKVVVVPVPDMTLDPVSIVTHCSTHLPKYAVPRYVEFVAALPKTTTNKVRKAELRQRGIGSGTWDHKFGRYTG